MNSIGETIDKIYALRTQRLKMEKAVQLLKSEEWKLSQGLIEVLKTQKFDRAGGNLASFSYSIKRQPNVKDFNKVFNFAKDNGDSILQRRISTSVWEEYADNGIEVPGVEVFEIFKPSLTKR